MGVRHISIDLPPYSRGFHVITDHIRTSLDGIRDTGIVHIFLQHTSAGLCINEAADPDVLVDFETIFDRLVPEDMSGLRHTIEGPDDMPAHIKTALTGNSLTIPMQEGRLLLGTWQGIYLCEFRSAPRPRRLVVSVLT